MRRLAIAIFAIAGVAMAYLKAYEVTPAKAQWSGWIDTTRGRNFIAQTITGDFDSLYRVQPVSWQSWRPDSFGLRCVGRWSYGPSLRVSLRVASGDTLVCLTRGSGASLIRFRSPGRLTLDLISDIDCYGIVSRAIIRDTIVFCGIRDGGTGIEIWDASNPERPRRLSYTHLPNVVDIAVKDSFLYAVSFDDSFRIFNVSDPGNPIQVGALVDSLLSSASLCVNGNYCYLAEQYGLQIIDVSNPRSPRRVAKIGGFEALSVSVRDTLCYVGTTTSPDEFALRVYNVRNPALPYPVGSLSGVAAYDIYLPPTCDTVLYTPRLHIINITNPRYPRQIGFIDCPGWDYGVAVVPALNYALVADYHKGLVAVNIVSPNAPLIDTTVFPADHVRDIVIDGDRAYLASYLSGFQILDVSNPASPSFLGGYDTVIEYTVNSVAARDSFAFVSWPRPRLISIDVSDPGMPLRAGNCANMFAPPEDMVLQDSFVYCAACARFEVVNIARPREPVLVGGCRAVGGVEVVVRDSFAYTVARAVEIINIARPDSPFVHSTITGHKATGIAIYDSFLYLPYVYDTLYVYSVANPSAPYLLSFVPTGVWPSDVVIDGSLLFLGTVSGKIETYDISSPAQPRRVASITAPCYVDRLYSAGGYIYAVMYDAGVAIYETTAIGICERFTDGNQGNCLFRILPNPTKGAIYLSLPDGNLTRLRVFDATGRCVKNVQAPSETQLEQPYRLDLSPLSAGVYFVEAEMGGIKKKAARVIKQ